MIPTPRHTRPTQAGSGQQARADHTLQKKAGRPQGTPSTIVNRRIPLDLLAQLDRSIDRLEVQTGLKANRGMMARRALALFLETHCTGRSALLLAETKRESLGTGPAMCPLSSLPSFVGHNLPSRVLHRIYTGADNQTHFQDLDPDAFATLAAKVGEGAIRVNQGPAMSFADFHNAPRRQYVVVMSGAMEIEISDGTTRQLVPGDVLVDEDLTGKGHITRGVWADPRISLAVPLAS